jgi:hypothetical protein
MALSLDGTTGISATGNIISSGGVISATGNIYGGNIIGTLVVSSATFSGNVTAGNLLTGGLISSTGNVSGNYFVGNGAALTGLSASKIFNGTSEANIGTSGGNANITIGGTSNVVVVATTGLYVTGLASVTGNLITGGDHSLIGNIVDTGTLWINTSSNGNINLNPNGTGQTNIPVGILSVTANVIGGNILTGGLMSSTGNAVHANVIINGTAAAGSGVLIVSGNIQTSTANATANIGNASNYFNRLFAQATTALYADLAEVYKADAQYPPGTVLVFGGTQEVTMSTQSHDTRIAGVVSTHPAHVMNSGLQSEFTVEVGLIGRVPCRVVGPITAGDRVVSSNRAGVAERLDMSKYQPGVIIGKAVESYVGTDVGTIEVVVGRL